VPFGKVVFAKGRGGTGDLVKWPGWEGGAQKGPGHTVRGKKKKLPGKQQDKEEGSNQAESVAPPLGSGEGCLECGRGRSFTGG